MGRKELSQLWHVKKETKERIFAKYWPKIDEKLPLLVLLAPKDQHHKEVFFHLLEGLLVLSLQIIILSDEEMPDMDISVVQKITWLQPAALHPTKLDEIFIACDMALLFDAHQDTMSRLFEKGVVPIGLEKSPFLENYHPNHETGNSFTYKNVNPWDIFSALVRATETYRFPYDWQNIVKGILKVR